MVQSIATWFNSGGPFMWVILTVLAVATAVVIERFLYFFIICAPDASGLTRKVTASLDECRTGETLTLLKKHRIPLFNLLRIAVERFHAGAPIEQIQEGIEEASIKEIPKIGKRLSYLSLFANMSTLVGLLGTIAGLQKSFGSLASVDAAQKAAMLSAGIAQAMNTTAFGLIVAVPCMMLYTLFSNKQQSLINDIDDAVVRVVNTMRTVRS